MKREVLCTITVMLCLVALNRVGHAETLIFRTTGRSHDAKPSSLPLMGATGSVRGYARRVQPRLSIYYDTESQTAYNGPLSTYWYTLPTTWTRTQNYPTFVPGTFPDIPDMWIDNFITETFTLDSLRVDAHIFENDPQPVRAGSANHADMILPIDGDFTASTLRGTYRVEGATESFETPFAIDFELEGHTEAAKADLYVHASGGRHAEVFPIRARFVPVDGEIASVVIDGVTIHARAVPFSFSSMIPEPTGAMPLLLGCLALWSRYRRIRAFSSSN